MTARSEFLYVLRPTRPAMLTDGPMPEESAALARHVDYLSDLAEHGTALLFGRTQTADESAIGLVISSADSPAEARLMMENDPAVAKKVMRAELFPYKIAGGALVAAPEATQPAEVD